MLFFLSSNSPADLARGQPYALLTKTTWDDYGNKTLHRLTFVDAQGGRRYLGMVKILQRGEPSTNVPEAFEKLGEDFCSLGESLDYYKALGNLEDTATAAILEGLRDVTIDPARKRAFEGEVGFERSLLRFPAARQALTEAGGLFGQRTPESVAGLSLSFAAQFDGFDGPHKIDLVFHEPTAQLGRMMALIGKNRTGKTQLLTAMAAVMSGVNLDVGTFEPTHGAPVLVISFSAFDGFTRPRPDDTLGQNYRYYGLLRPGSGKGSKGRASVEHAFDRLGESLRSIAAQPDRARLWTDLVEEAGVFRSEGLESPFTTGEIDGFVEQVRLLSSGHQMVVLVLTGLAESIREGSFVFFDEPETHFHPGLLSTVLRLLYSLLEKYQAYGIVATHSPVVLQEVPARSVRVLSLDGQRPVTRRYRGESFGANLGEITREAFGVDDDVKSHVSILRKLSEKMPRREVEALFEGLGLGMKMLLDDIYEEGGQR